MTHYFSWIVLEHHIHHFEQIKRDTRSGKDYSYNMSHIEIMSHTLMSHYSGRQDKLHKRLDFYNMKQELIDLVLSREVGVWEAILCMNPGIF